MPRDDEKDGSEWSKEGTLLHLHLAQPQLDRSGLKIAQAETLTNAEVIISTIFESVGRNMDIDPNTAFLEKREKAMIFSDRRGHPLFKGTADLVRTWPVVGATLVADAKMGFQAVTPAAANLQTACYAVMEYDDNPVERIFTAIAQPRAPYGERMSMAVYTSEAMGGIRNEVLSIDAASKEPDAPLHASPSACQYCRAKEVCPAYRAQFQVVATTSLESMLALPAEEFARIGDAIKLADMLKKHWSAEAVRRIEAGEMPGWKLKDNGRTSGMKDLRSAYVRFTREYGDKFPSQPDAALAFMACLDPKWGKLEELFMTLENAGKGKARAKINELFAGLIEHEEKAKSPVRV